MSAGKQVVKPESPWDLPEDNRTYLECGCYLYFRHFGIPSQKSVHYRGFLSNTCPKHKAKRQEKNRRDRFGIVQDYLEHVQHHILLSTQEVVPSAAGNTSSRLRRQGAEVIKIRGGKGSKLDLLIIERESPTGTDSAQLARVIRLLEQYGKQGGSVARIRANMHVNEPEPDFELLQEPRNYRQFRADVKACGGRTEDKISDGLREVDGFFPSKVSYEAYASRRRPNRVLRT